MLRSARVRRWLDQLLHTHDTPQRTAAAFATGVFFGFSPFLGLHTILGLIVAFTFGLNRVAVLLGVYSNLPWILPAYYTLATGLGAVLLGADIPPGLLNDLRDSFRTRSWSELRTIVGTMMPLVWAFALGSMIGAVGLAGGAYLASLAMITAHRGHSAADAPREPTDP